MSTRENQPQDRQRVPIVDGDYNNSPFYGQPNTAVAPGDVVIAHDDDPTIDDHWAIVTKVRLPSMLHGPDPEVRNPYGLATVMVLWASDLENAAQAHLAGCRRRNSSWSRLADEDYARIIGVGMRHA